MNFRLQVFKLPLKVPHCHLKCHVVRILGAEAVGVQRHLFCYCSVVSRKVCDGGAILRCGLCQIGKFHGHIWDVVRCVVPPLLGGLLLFPQVGLRLDEVRLERCPGIFLLRLGPPGPSVFLKISCFCDEAVCNAYDLSLCYGLTRRGHIINTLVKPCVEAFEWFIGIVILPELRFILC